MKKELQIASQLRHPDAFFYDLISFDGDISGMFQADNIQPFSICKEDFLAAAERLGYIADYDHRTGKIYIADQYEGTEHSATDWIEYICAEHREANEILKEAYEAEQRRELQEITRVLNVREVESKHIDAAKDENFCAAILDLAEIIRANNPDWVEYREMKREAV